MLLRLSLALAAVVVALVAVSVALGASVHLRVEGSTETLFDGTIETGPHTVMGHTCDGTNAGANPGPGPTMTGALDDSSLDWAGTWFESFQDFAVDRIGPDASDLAGGRFWGLVLNFVPTSVGGCQQQVEDGDGVLFAYDLFSKEHILRLSSGAAVVQVGEAVTLTVVDGEDGIPVDGAVVGGRPSDSSGQVALSFAASGTHTLKATKADSIRSNSVTVCVYDPAAGGCGISPTPPPVPTSGSSAPAPEPVAPSAAPAGPGPFTPPAVEPVACFAVSVAKRDLPNGKRATLRVVVRNGGAAVRGARVVVSGEGILKRATTGASGVARFSVVPKGRGAITIGIRSQIKRCGVIRLSV